MLVPRCAAIARARFSNVLSIARVMFCFIRPQCQLTRKIREEQSDGTTKLQYTYSFVMVSSRFKIVLATVVQAASSLGLIFGLHRLTPTLNSFSAAARS